MARLMPVPWGLTGVAMLITLVSCICTTLNKRRRRAAASALAIVTAKQEADRRAEALKVEENMRRQQRVNEAYALELNRVIGIAPENSTLPAIAGNDLVAIDFSFEKLMANYNYLLSQKESVLRAMDQWHTRLVISSLAVLPYVKTVCRSLDLLMGGANSPPGEWFYESHSRAMIRASALELPDKSEGLKGAGDATDLLQRLIKQRVNVSGPLVLIKPPVMIPFSSTRRGSTEGVAGVQLGVGATSLGALRISGSQTAAKPVWVYKGEISTPVGTFMYSLCFLDAGGV